MLREDFLTYEKAVEFLKDENIKNQREYGKWIKGKSEILKLPAGPRNFYKNFGWTSWANYLSNNNISLKNKQFHTYEECLNVIRNNNIKSRKEYRDYRQKSNNELLPFDPTTYKEWKNWASFLGLKEKYNFIKYKDAKEYVNKLKLKSSKEWAIWIKNKPDYIPACPNNVYKEWTTWGDYWDISNIDHILKNNII